MPWGHTPSFRINHQTLNFHLAQQIYRNPELRHKKYLHINIATQRPSQSHYWIECNSRVNPVTNKRADCYQVKMYDTYIHSWWEDGTYQSVYWDSHSTHYALEAFGPIKRIWNHSRCIFREHARFRIDGNEYPYGSDGCGVVVHPDGYIYGLVDKKQRIKLDCRAERRELLAQYRERATPRILLGEFDEMVVDKLQTVRKPFGNRYTGRWWGVNMGHASKILFSQLSRNADHDEIVRIIGNIFTHSSNCIPAANREDALVKTLNTISKMALEDSEWYEWYDIPYGPVRVNHL